MSDDLLSKLKELEAQPLFQKEEKSEPLIYSGSSYPKDDRWKYPVSKDEALVYTDGGGHSWCYIYIDHERWVLRSNYEDHVTSNSMELTAIARGLQLARLLQNKKATFFSDSQYAVNTINVWMHKWEKRGWKRGSKAEVKNLTVIQKIFDIKRELEIEGVWIKGHDGHLLNEICDQIVVRTSETRKNIYLDGKDFQELRQKLHQININL